MSLLDKLKFWKKEDEFDFDFDKKVDHEMGKTGTQDLRLGHPGEKSFFDEHTETKPFGSEEPSSGLAAFQAARTGASTSNGGNRDLELINSKLDTIKAILNSLDQRMASLERSSAGGKKEEKLW